MIKLVVLTYQVCIFSEYSFLFPIDIQYNPGHNKNECYIIKNNIKTIINILKIFLLVSVFENVNQITNSYVVTFIIYCLYTFYKKHVLTIIK